MTEAKRSVTLTINMDPAELATAGPSVPVEVKADGNWHSATAQIDTGAGHSCISSDLAARLKLAVSGGIFQSSPGAEPRQVPVHRTGVRLPGGTELDIDLAILPGLGAFHDVLLGRDVLRYCRLSVDFTTGRIELNMQFPGA